jgi:hypothetical protein
VVVLLASAFLALGLVNLNVGRGWWRGQLVRLAVGLPPIVVYVYFTLPPLVFPQAIALLLMTLVPNAV